jgi:hypothetical protein
MTADSLQPNVQNHEETTGCGLRKKAMGMLTKTQRVRSNKDVDYKPYTLLQAGECATVIHVATDATGVVEAVEVLMDKSHEGLNLWANAAYLVDPDLAALEPLTDAELTTMKLVASLVWFLFLGG